LQHETNKGKQAGGDVPKRYLGGYRGFGKDAGGQVFSVAQKTKKKAFLNGGGGKSMRNRKRAEVVSKKSIRKEPGL